jgi:prepilin-type N-terminal cleavage/methylation domain-containing protein
MKMQRIARQAGFTLVEIAIVLVIIGVLLAGVLQGQEMIDNARIKSIVSTMRGIQAGMNGYVDRFQTLPGDETVANMAARGWTVTAGAAAAAANNGVLVAAPATTFTAAGQAGERLGFFQALRAAGFLTGNPADVGLAALPRHANGTFGLAVGAVYGITGTHICASGLPTKFASAVDVLIDGPLPVTNIGNDVGNLRAATGAANPLAPAAVAPAGLEYNETATLTRWTVCMRIG